MARMYSNLADAYESMARTLRSIKDQNDYDNKIYIYGIGTEYLKNEICKVLHNSEDEVEGDVNEIWTDMYDIRADSVINMTVRPTNIGGEYRIGANKIDIVAHRMYKETEKLKEETKKLKEENLEMREEIKTLHGEISELREMIRYMPGSGVEYMKAKEEFEELSEKN